MRIGRSALLLVAGLLSGCGTVQSLITYPEPFGGAVLAAHRDPSSGGAVVLMGVDVCVSAVVDLVLLPATIPMAAYGGDAPGEPVAVVDVELPPLEDDLFISRDSSRVLAGWLTFDDEGDFAKGIVVPVGREASAVSTVRLSRETLESFPALARELEARRLKSAYWTERAERAGPEAPSWDIYRPFIHVFDDTRALVFPGEVGADDDGDDGASVATELWSVAEAPRRIWSQRLPLREAPRGDGAVSLVSSDADSDAGGMLLVAAPPAALLVVDPATGTVVARLPGLENVESIGSEPSELDVFAFSPDLDLLARGERERGIVHVARLHARDEAVVTLEVPWGLQGMWWVNRLRFEGGRYLVVEYHARWRRLYATVVYSLHDSRVVWSEARFAIDSVVVAPDGTWLAYLRDDRTLEITPLAPAEPDLPRTAWLEPALRPTRAAPTSR